MEYQFKIKLKGVTKPPVWRKVVIPANFTFLKFHDVWDTNTFNIDKINACLEQV